MNTGTRPLNPPITPGEIVLKEYLQPMGISHNAMARAVGMALPGTPSSSSAPLSPKRAVTPAMSIRFGAVLASRSNSGRASKSSAISAPWGSSKKRLRAKIRPAMELAHAT